jgi:hypothetical protein
MVFGERTINLGLQEGGLFLSSVKLFLSGLYAKHRVAISLKHVRFLSRSLHDILHNAAY